MICWPCEKPMDITKGKKKFTLRLPVTTYPKEKPNTRIEIYNWNRPLFLIPIYIWTYNYDPQFQALLDSFNMDLSSQTVCDLENCLKNLFAATNCGGSMASTNGHQSAFILCDLQCMVILRELSFWTLDTRHKLSLIYLSQL